jgi:hypothetical protein
MTPDVYQGRSAPHHPPSVPALKPAGHTSDCLAAIACPSSPHSLPTVTVQMIKEQMDKKFGSPWHVVVGKAFGYEITYEVRNILYIFVGGRTSVLLWKM